MKKISLVALILIFVAGSTNGEPKDGLGVLLGYVQLNGAVKFPENSSFDDEDYSTSGVSNICSE